MYFYRFPFLSAPHPEEWFYRHIWGDRPDLFWEAHIAGIRRPGQNLNIPEDFKHLVAQMLHRDPAQRPSIAEIRNHPWVLNLSRPED